MKTKNELFIDAVDYLIDNGLAHDQSDVALQAGLGPNLISRVRNGKVKNVSDDSIRALVAKFNLNIDYFRGKSEYLSRYDQSCANMEHELKEAQKLLDKNPYPKASEPAHPEIPDYVKRLCEETARLATRNELLERQCEQLIAELRVSKDKNDAFLLELRKSQEFNDSLVAELKISRTQNDTLITELRESRKKFDAVVKELDGLKDQFSMALSQHPKFTEEDLGVLRVNDKGEALLTIQVPPVKATTKSKSKTKNAKAPFGYIRGNVKVITDKMVQQALAAFPQNKK